MKPKAYDYGRQPLRIPVHAEDRSAPSCAKCRHLVPSDTPGTEYACAKGHPFNPLECGQFSDASRQRDYFANFDYNGRWRR